MRVETRSQYLEEVCRLAGKKTKLAGCTSGKPMSGGSFSAFGGLPAAGECPPSEKFSASGKLSKELDKEEEAFFAAAGEAFSGGLFLPMEYLTGITKCSPFERHCVLMALGYELGVPSQADCARLNGSETQPGLTPELLARSWQGEPDAETVCRAFREDGLLMRVFFQRAGAAAPFAGQVLCLKPRIRSFLLGELTLSGEESRVIGACFPEEELPPLAENQPDAAAVLDGGAEVVEFLGAEGSGRCFCARTVCRKLGKRAFPVYLGEAAARGWTPKETGERAALESLLFQAAPILLVPGQWDRQERKLWLGALMEPLLEVSRPVFVTGPRESGVWARGGKPRVQSFEVRGMSLVESRQVWQEEGARFAFAPGVKPEDMANLFHFTRGQIREALENASFDARKAQAEAGGGGTERAFPIGRDSLRRGCYSLFERQLVTKAVRIPQVYGWEDLILPRPQKEKLRAAVAQVRRRHQVYEEWGFQQKMPYGQGVSMIFAGPPGTGKTMAAQVFAGELGLDLYKVELSAVVSKFVGETEKNLNEIFSQAEKSQVVLFFDEADVLFAKRTEVKEANDKYSNMEAAFLLQKIEAYDGVTVLATNLIQNFDEAFKRRVKFVIDFPFPGREERGALWRKAIPERMPAEELDYEYLAETFELSGSNIRNIVLHAAFLAAEREKALGMEEILLAVKNEFSKSGKTLTRAELGEYHMLLPEVG